MSAVLGRCRRTGRWRLAARSNVLALFGSVRLDMRHSFVEGDEPDELKMKVMVLFGSAVLILPEGAEVRPSGVSFLSAEWVDVPDHVPVGLPTLEVEWTCVFGRVHVVTGSVLEKAAREKAAQEQATAEVPAAGVTAGGVEAAGAGIDAVAGGGASDRWSPAPEPVAEIVVDMGMVDSKPWSMSDFEQAELEAVPAPTPEPEATTAPEPEAETAPASEEAAAPQLVEAWRTHDWGPGITHRDDEDDEDDEQEDDASATAGASA